MLSRWCLSLLLSLLSSSAASIAAATDRPNILWIIAEDHGPHLGCYGDDAARTPRLDALAAEGLRFETCWSSAPVCAAARTTLLIGRDAVDIGAGHMRSAIRPPSGLITLPMAMRDAGYATFNGRKTDYNFPADFDAGWERSGSGIDWRCRTADDDRPFLSLIHLGDSHEGELHRLPPAAVTVSLTRQPAPPAHHPDTPAVRRDWRRYRRSVTRVDAAAGEVLDRLEADGLAESTIVIYHADHGAGLPRHKRSLFDSGLRVPLIVRVPPRFRNVAPEGYAAGAVSTRPVAFPDLTATVLRLAGAAVPDAMTGIAFAGGDVPPPPPYVFGFRGRMGPWSDMSRACTDGRYVYVRHFYPERPTLRPIRYAMRAASMTDWKRRFDAGTLADRHAAAWRPRPSEMLFDLELDPAEIDNLAGDPAQRSRLIRMRAATRQHMDAGGDRGVFPEPMLQRGDAEAITPDDFRRLVDAAWRCTGGPVDPQTRRRWATDPVPAIRYWAARGCSASDDSTINGSTTDSSTTDDATTDILRRLTTDDDPTVRVAAWETVVRGGTTLDRPTAIDALIELADPTRDGTFVAMAALDALSAATPLDTNARRRLADLPADPNPPYRCEKYLDEIVGWLTADAPQLDPAP